MALQRNLASLEGANYAFALNSGMSATISVLSTLEKGDHLLCINDVYGGTQSRPEVHAKDFRATDGHRIAWEMIDFSDLNLVRAHIKKNTKIVWIESPTNPTLKCTERTSQQSLKFQIDQINTAVPNIIVIEPKK